MRYKALFLDFYGTLVHEDDEAISQIVKKIQDSSPGNPDPKTIAIFWWTTFRNLIEDSFLDSFQTQRHLETLSIQIVLEHFHCTAKVPDIDRELFDYWIKPDIFPETKEFLLRTSLPICIVSNIDRNDIQAALKFHRIECDMLVTSEDARSYKPRNEIFLLALDKMGKPPSCVLHIGDSLTSDIVGANNCGIDSFWINRKGKIVPPNITPTHSGSSILDVCNLF